MTKAITLRHYCGELVYAEIYDSHGETIPAFFGKHDVMAVIRDCPGCGEELDLDYCGSPWLVEPMDDLMAGYTAANKFCSNCWGRGFELRKAYDIEGKFIGTRVVCVECQEETVGYVSMNHITAQRADDRVYYRMDIGSISRALELEPPTSEEKDLALGIKRTYLKDSETYEARNIRELGF